MYGDLRVVVVMPAHNEEQLIAQAVRSLPAFVDRLLVVDDGSSDRTVDNALAAGDTRLEILRHRKNRGVGAAIVTGYRRALVDGADVVVVMGGDAQMDPSEMDRLIEPIAVDRADYVKGNRLSHPELAVRMPASRLWANRLLTRLTGRMTGRPDLSDSQCGYTAISRRALQRLPLNKVWPRYGYPNDLISLLVTAGFRVEDRPVTPIYGRERSGIHPLTIVPTLALVFARIGVRNLR